MSEPTEKKRPRISLAAKILIGMGLGILTGLFFGELVAIGIAR